MTREESIEILKDLWRTKYSIYLEADIRKALEMAIQVLEQESFDDLKYHAEHGEVIVDKAVWEDAEKALKQQTCDDAISRKAILSKIKEVCFGEAWLQYRIDYGSNGQRDFLINYIEQMPSVTAIEDTLKEEKHDSTGTL